MNTHADKTQENKSQSVANEISQKQSGGESTFQFVDNRPEAVAQRKLQDLANNSPRAMQFKAIQEMANNSPQAKQALQLQGMADHYSTQQHPIQKRENNTGLPDSLKTGMENLSGMSLDDVKVHRNSDKPAQLQAHAYAQGTDIHLASGQEKHLPHEAWHVVQQKQGRVKPTMQMKGGVSVNDDVGLEKEADVMGVKAIDPAQKVAQRRVNEPQDLLEDEGFSFKNNLLDESSQKNLPEESYKSETPQKEDPNQQKIEEISTLVEESIKKCEDTRELHTFLQGIKEKYNLKFAELVDIGTPKARVRFRVNPIEEIQLPSGELIYRMTGTASPNPITNVQHNTKTLNIGGQSALVGTRMIANPLAPDHESGSLSTNDSAQDGIMSTFPNAGNKTVPNDQKYIKGHLLNDHVGGQGTSYNLFPITADANSKHLAFVEKYVKSQLASHYVIYYEMVVDDGPVVELTESVFYVNSKFKFYWYLLDATSGKFGSQHVGDIESNFNLAGTAPFDVTVEYAGEYDALNKGKKTPNAIGQTGQWQESTITSPPMVVVGTSVFSSPSSFSGMSGHIGFGPPLPTSLPNFSSSKVKTDTIGLNFISLRNPSAVGLATGQAITVATGVVSITAVNPLSGGWTRVYF